MPSTARTVAAAAPPAGGVSLGNPRRGLPLQRVGRGRPEPDQHDERDRPRQCQHREAQPVRTTQGEHESDQQRAEHGADLVQRLMQAEGIAAAQVGGRVRQHRVAGGGAHRLAHPFTVVEQAGHGEVAADRDQRHADRRHGIADDRLRPRLAGAIGQPAGHQPQHERRRLAGTGDHTDHGGRRSERSQVRADDRSSTLVDHVGAGRDDAEADHEPHRRQPVDRLGPAAVRWLAAPAAGDLIRAAALSARLAYWPSRPSIRSRSRSAWPLCRAYSSTMCTSSSRSEMRAIVVRPTKSSPVCSVNRSANATSSRHAAQPPRRPPDRPPHHRNHRPAGPRSGNAWARPARRTGAGTRCAPPRPYAVPVPAATSWRAPPRAGPTARGSARRT